MIHLLENLCDPETFESLLSEGAPAVLHQFGKVGESSIDIAHCTPYPLVSGQLFDFHIPHWGFVFNDGQTLALTEAHNYLLAERDTDGTIRRVADVGYHTFPKLHGDESAAALLTPDRLSSVLLHMANHLDDADFPSLIGYARVEQDGYRTVAYHGPWYSHHPFAGQALDALVDDGEAYRVVPFKKGAEVGAVDPLYKGPVLITRVQSEVIQPEDSFEALLDGLFGGGQDSFVEIRVIGPWSTYSLGGDSSGGPREGLFGDSPDFVIYLPRSAYRDDGESK